MTAAFRVLIICTLVAVALCSETHSDPYEEILKDIEDEQDYLSLLNRLDIIVREPINLLEADKRELGRLPWVSPWLAREIVALRQRGELDSVDDLVKIEGVDRRLIELLRPFVAVVPPRKMPGPLEAALRMRVIASPLSSSYEGVKTYVRGYARCSDYDAGMLVEKDRDETQFNDLQTIFVGVRFPRGRLIIGDFLVTSGHGLVFSNPYGLSPSTVEPWRFSQGDFGIKPYTSVDENFAMRGVAVEYGDGQTGLCAAYSRARFDATLDEDGRVKSLGTTGLHTAGAGGEDAIREDMVGLAVRTGRGPVGLGLDVMVTKYDHDVAIGRLDHLGRTWTPFAGVNLTLLGKSSTGFVQGALADGGGGGVIGGFGYDREKLEMLVLGRYYDERFLSLHARPFAFYSGLATGERGLLARVTLDLPAEVRVSVGSDLHKRRPEQEGLASPSGSESFLALEIPAGDFTFQLGEKLLRTEQPPAHPADPTEERTRLRSRLDIRYQAVRWFDIRMRYENLRYRENQGQDREESSSDLLRLDLAARLGRVGTFKLGFQSFTIGSYGARLYQYEPGIPYYPAIEMLKSDGSRWYSVLSVGVPRFGRLAAKYGMTIYNSEGDRSQFLFHYSVRL